MSGERGLSVAQALLQQRHEIVRIVIPDSAVDTPLATKCANLEVEVLTAQNVNDDSFIEHLSSLKPQLLVVAGYPTIFRNRLLNIAKRGSINLHGGRLPQYRGGSPLNWQIINGEAAAGISVTLLTENIDSGDILAEADIQIDLNDTIHTVHMRANELFPALTLEVLENLDNNKVVRRVQEEHDACYWHQRNDNDGLIAWSGLSAAKVYDFVRALTHPYPGAFSYSEGERVRFFKVTVPDCVLRGTPGRVFYVQGQGPYIVCQDRAILVHEYQFEKNVDAKLRHGVTLG